MSPRAPGAVSPTVRRRILEAHGVLWLAFGAMILQGALGIYLNLYVPLSAPSDPNAVFPIVFSQPILAVHFLNALFLVALAAVLFARSGAAHVPGLRAGAGVLLLAFVVAAYSGYHFVGTEDNIYSFSMEMGFFAALVLAVVLLARTAALVRAADASAPPTERDEARGEDLPPETSRA